jgi:serine/threonine-protein kinase
MPKPLRPSTLDGIKRLAKSIKDARGITHTEALNVAARQAGYQSFTHARHQLTADAGAPVGEFPVRPRGGPNTRHDEFLDLCIDAWVQTLEQFTPRHEDQRIWSGQAAIRNVLDKVLAHTRSHAHLPTGGGHDFELVRSSREAGVLEFQVERGSVFLARPKKLILERFARQPAESFLLLELAELQPSGAYEAEADDEDSGSDSDWFNRREEVLELAPLEYVERSVWDEGHLGYDDDGREIPLPGEARLVTRWFNGKMLFVTKGSMWNGTPATYDGRHDTMSAEEIRAMIERSLRPSLAAE